MVLSRALVLAIMALIAIPVACGVSVPGEKEGARVLEERGGCAAWLVRPENLLGFKEEKGLLSVINFEKTSSKMRTNFPIRYYTLYYKAEVKLQRPAVHVWPLDGPTLNYKLLLPRQTMSVCGYIVFTKSERVKYAGIEGTGWAYAACGHECAPD